MSIGIAAPLLSAPARLLAASSSPTPTPSAGTTATPASSPTATTAATPTSVATAATAPAPTSTPAAAPAPPPPSPSSDHWVQALAPIPLWSGTDDQAIQLGLAARWDYFKILKPQQGPRLFVLVARTGGVAYVDALSVGPSGPPPANWPADAAPVPTDLGLGWVATTTDTPLYADDQGQLFLGLAPIWTPLKQMAEQDGPYLQVQDPFSGSTSYVDATLVGPIGDPGTIEVSSRWWGVLAVDGANLRTQPTTQSDSVAQLPRGSALVVSAWVPGEEVIPDNTTWARLGDNAYLYSSVLRPVALPSVPQPPAAGQGYSGRWIDMNLTQQVVVAYEGSNAVYVARTSTGRPTWETNTGTMPILRRVENETMTSSSLLGLDAERASYKVDNVRWTQYFTNDGKALHENYWKPRDEFGIPSSHGCAGLVAEDALYFWNWAGIGTPIVSHY